MPVLSSTHKLCHVARKGLTQYTLLRARHLRAPAPRTMSSSQHGSLIRPDLRHYVGADNLAFNERIKSLQQAGQKIYHFGFGQAPFPVCEPMVEGLRQNAMQMAYLPVQGILELREQICELHRRHDRLALAPDQVVVAPGTKELIYLLMTVFNGEILLVSPSWTTYKPQTQLASHKPHIVTTDMATGWKITPHQIDKTISENNLSGKNMLLVLCNPCNPTGTSYRKDDLIELTAYFRKNNIIVLCDEIYSRLHYEQDHHSLATYYPEGTILSSGFSKWASAGGWRLGYHVYPAELNELKRYVLSAASHTYSCAPAPMQYAVLQALRDHPAECDKYIAHTARIMKTVGEFSHRELTSVGVRGLPPTAGYYFMPDFEACRAGFRRRGITDGQAMCDAMLAECSVALMPGGPAFLRPPDELTVRFCFVNFSGAEGLAFSYKLGLDKPLPDDFVQTYATPVYDGVMALKEWVKKHIAQD